jgi:hypothetical protein
VPCAREVSLREQLVRVLPHQEGTVHPQGGSDHVSAYVESYGAGEPYLPVLEALGRLCRGPEGTQLVSVLRQYAPSWLVQMPALLPPAEWEVLQRMMGHTAQTRMLREWKRAARRWPTGANFSKLVAVRNGPTAR